MRQCFVVSKFLRQVSLLLVTALSGLLAAPVSEAKPIVSEYTAALREADHEVFSGDVNGDGVIDLLFRSRNQFGFVAGEYTIPVWLRWRSTFVLLSAPDGSFSLMLNPGVNLLARPDWGEHEHQPVYMDVDRDGVEEMVIDRGDADAALLIIGVFQGAPVLWGARETPTQGAALPGVIARPGLQAVTASADVPKAATVAGRTQGSFDVTPSGTASYDIPLWVPNGPNGVQPNLSIRYDSRRPQGTMGPGWTLTGLGAVQRCNKTFAQDAAPAAVTLTTTDGYCLDGKRLRLVSGTYGANSSRYHTEIADFSNVLAFGAVGGGPAYFQAATKDGLIYEYGNSADSRVTASGTSTPYQWRLNKVRDRNGNNYAVTYGPGVGGSSGISVPMAISYTPSSAGATTYRYQVAFEYRADNDDGTEVGYRAGGSTVNPNLLVGVSVKRLDAPAATIRTYTLGYGISPTTNRSRLAFVQECSDDTKTKCLAPTTIGYQNGDVGVSSSVSATLSDMTSIKGAYDFNGDGRQDVLYASGSTLFVAFGTATGYAAPANTGITLDVLHERYDAGDLIASGKDDILVTRSGYWYRYYWTGTSFSGVSSGTLVDSAEQEFLAALADVNGDGLPDLVTYQQGYIYTRLNASAGGAFALSATRTSAYYAPGTTGLIVSTFRGSTRRGLDFNGDGRGDIAVLNIAGGHALLASAGHTFANWGYESHVPLFINWNDDKCTDYIVDDTIKLSKCNGFPSQALVIGRSFYGVMDWDGDGRDDVLVYGDAGKVGVRRSTGSGLGELITTSITAGFQTWVWDGDGDGLDDLLTIGQFYPPYTASYRRHNAAGSPPDLVSSITDGYGVNVSPAYTSIVSGSYTKGSGATYPERDLQVPLYVVRTVQSTDGAGSVYTRTHTYSGARESVQGRGFSGFQTVTVTDSRSSSLAYKTHYRTAFPYTGFAHQSDVFQNNGTTLVSRTVQTPSLKTLSSTAYQQRYFPYVSATSESQYEVGGTKNGQLAVQSSASFVYDDYGNLTSSTTTLSDKDSTAPQSPTYNQSWTTTVTNAITPNTTEWCLGVPTQSTTMRSGTGVPAITRTTSYTPDYVKCRITQAIVEPSSTNYKVTFGFGYDSFGNVSSQTVTGIGMAARTSTVTWGTTGQFPESVKNALNQTTTTGYDYNLGLPSSIKDPNNITTSWLYDEFGRPKTETRSDSTKTAFEYYNCASVSGGCQHGDPGSASTSVNKLVVVATEKDTSGATLRDDWLYLDQFDRTVVTRSKTLSGGYSRIGTQYDAFGRVYRQTAPCDATGCSTYWVTNSYDALHRLTQESRPVSAAISTQQVTKIAYQGMTTVTTDAQNKTATKIEDPNGWLRRSVDHNGYYQAFTYDAFGSLKSVTDSQSNSLFSANYDYGLAAFRRQTADMDLGTWTYIPNALGEMTSYTDANGTTFSFTYDNLSRPLTRKAATVDTTTWTWGSSASLRNIGRLQGLTSTQNGTTETYSYDVHGRLSQRQIVADATYNYNFGYNAATGFLDSLTYPTSTAAYRLKLRYGYQNGLLKQISDFNASGTVFWKADATNARGQVTRETLGNGIVANYGFDAVTGWLSSAQAGPGGGTSTFNDAYQYDKVGNVTQRRNINKNLTEDFYYDNLHRLDYSQLNGVTNLDLAYDALGNITQRCEPTCGSTWIYHSTKKHAVTQASVGSTTYTYGYDANGRVTSRNGHAVSWNRYNYPTLVKGPNQESVGLYYDASFRRWKQVYVLGGVTETTIYVGGLLEKVTTGTTTDWRHQIRANGRTVAIASRMSTGANTTRYMLEDHQGSIARITKSDGSTAVGESFTAFGTRRDPATWSGAPPAASMTVINGVSRQGYTGHTALGTLGLNHMNGRVQDSLTGRFLSADPYVTKPGNTQNFNRYSYVHNNPLSLVDPSGFDACQNEDGAGLCIIGEPIIDAGDAIVDGLYDIGSAVFDAVDDLFSGLFGGSSRPPPPPAEPSPQFDGVYADGFTPYPTIRVSDRAYPPDRIPDRASSIDRSVISALASRFSSNLQTSGDAIAGYWENPWAIPGAALDSMQALPVLGVISVGATRIGTAARGGLHSVRVGFAGEAAVRAAVNIGPATRITVNGSLRIPDGLTASTLSEVKNVGSLAYTQQLRDFAQFAGQNGMRFDLYVRPTTLLSGPLQDAVASGAINLRYIPGL